MFLFKFGYIVALIHVFTLYAYHHDFIPNYLPISVDILSSHICSERTGKTLRFTIESRRRCRNGKSCKFKDYEEIKSSNTLATDS